MSLSSYSFSHEAMTTFFEVIIAGQEREYARQAAAAAFREIDRMESLLNRYEAGSDVGQINLLQEGRSVRVSADVVECIQAAQWVHAQTDGLFDPTIGPLMACWKDPNGGVRQPSDQALTEALSRVGMSRLVVDAANFTVAWAGNPGSLDLGGIGKGYAIDRAAELLTDWGVETAVISGGGSTALAIGSAPGTPDGWRLGIGGRWGDAAGCGAVVLKNRALSGSGKDVKGDHIIHPGTGKPASAHLAAWAVAKTAALSDGLATAFMLMERDRIEALCGKHPGMGAFIVLPDEQIVKIGLETVGG